MKLSKTVHIQDSGHNDGAQFLLIEDDEMRVCHLENAIAFELHEFAVDARQCATRRARGIYHIFDRFKRRGSQESWEPVGLGNRRMQIDRSGLFFAAFLTNIQILACEIVKNYPRWGRFSLSTT